ncbi:hypothetical protein ACQ4M3_20640 [Leptolyngbya sp. AN03gr2]|uniref:hypothetical protein n=1 Tax=unclassified Leptolyngbya TaxID=2650499 RepID=UPI003D316A6D
MNYPLKQQIEWTEAEQDFLKYALINVLGPATELILEKLWHISNRTDWENQVLSNIPASDQGKVQHVLSWVVPNQMFLTRCENALTQCVGPISRWMIEEHKKDLAAKPPRVWIDFLASQISDRYAAETFRWQTLIFSEEHLSPYEFIVSTSNSFNSK